MFFPITTQASLSVIIISVLVIIVGGLMIAVLVGCLLFVKYERPSKSKDYYFDKDDHDKIFPRVAILVMVCIVMHACEFSSYCVFYMLKLFHYSFLL